jgi:hypothetical protein
MGVAYLTHRNRSVDRSTLRSDESAGHILSFPEKGARLRGDEPPLWGEEYSGDVLSLLEENARLRGLVVELSTLLLRKRC